MGNIPITGSIDQDIRELHRSGIFHGPQGLTLYDQRKHVLGLLLGLAYLHCSPFVDGRLLCWEVLPNPSLPIESGANVDAVEIVDSEGGSLTSDVLAVATNCHVKDLSITSVAVARWLQLKGEFPLLGEGGEGCETAVSFQQMFSWQGKYSDQ